MIYNRFKKRCRVLSGFCTQPSKICHRCIRPAYGPTGYSTPNLPDAYWDILG